MEPSVLLSALVELAEDAGLTVRRLGPGGAADGLPVASSAVCRVRGAVWVVLSEADPVEERIAVVAGAVRDHAGDTLEQRYLPPAVRAVVGE